MTYNMMNSIENQTETNYIAIDEEGYLQSSAEGRNDTEKTLTIKLEDLLNESSSAMKVDTTAWLPDESEV